MSWYLLHSDTQSDFIQITINHLQNKSQNTTMEGHTRIIFLWGLQSPFITLTTCSNHVYKTGSKLGALLPHARFLSFFSNLVFPGSLQVVSVELSAFSGLLEGTVWASSRTGIFSHPHCGMRDTSKGRGVTGLVLASRPPFHNGVVSQRQRTPNYVTP